MRSNCLEGDNWLRPALRGESWVGRGRDGRSGRSRVPRDDFRRRSCDEFRRLPSYIGPEVVE